MCGRFIPLSVAQVMDVIRGLADAVTAGTYTAITLGPDWETVLRDAYPGSRAQLVLPLWGEDAERAARETAGPGVVLPETGLALACAERQWGFEPGFSNGRGPLFNTRIETAEKAARTGSGFWRGPIQSGRCVVPCRAFFEPSRDETVRSPRTGRPVKRQYEFARQGEPVTLLGAVQADGRFSVVTTEPNAQMEPVHDRMPLVLSPEEALRWMAPGDGWRALADRSQVPLRVRPEDLPEPAQPALF